MGVCVCAHTVCGGGGGVVKPVPVSDSCLDTLRDSKVAY